MDSRELRRFKAKWVQQGNCWQWTDSLVTQGYGRLMLSNRRATYAHRIAYAHYRGPVVQGDEVRHTCGNRGCVNPDHLKLVPAARVSLVAAG